MTVTNLTTGSMVWRRVAVAGTAARLGVVTGAFMMLCANASFAQRALTSVVLPTDTTTPRKVAGPRILGVPVNAPATTAPAMVTASLAPATTSVAPVITPAKPANKSAGPKLLGMAADGSDVAAEATTSTIGAATTTHVSSFARAQLANQRVLEARTDKRMELKQLFRERGMAYPAAEIFMRVFKREHVLEMWVRPEGKDRYTLLKTYQVCALSDNPGPKRTKGDLQTPEGFYYIDDFNPQSDYHLSLRVNYPNESDRILGADHTMGGDIFIHGGCRTAGCMAVTDENIKEIYWLAVEARDNGQTRIPVHIFPARLTTDAVQQLARVFDKKPDLVRFWSNIKPGFEYFELNHKLPAFTVNNRGRYQYGTEDKSDLLGKPMLADSATLQH